MSKPLTWRDSLQAAINNLELRAKTLETGRITIANPENRAVAAQSLRFAAERFREVLDCRPHEARKALEKLNGGPLT